MYICVYTYTYIYVLTYTYMYLGSRLNFVIDLSFIYRSFVTYILMYFDIQVFFEIFVPSFHIFSYMSLVFNIYFKCFRTCRVLLTYMSHLSSSRRNSSYSKNVTKSSSMGRNRYEMEGLGFRV